MVRYSMKKIARKRMSPLEFFMLENVVYYEGDLNYVLPLLFVNHQLSYVSSFSRAQGVTMSTCLVHNNIKYQVCLEDLMFNFLDQILKLLSLYCCCQVLLKAHCPLHKLEQLLWTNLLLSACFKNVLFS